MIFLYVSPVYGLSYLRCNRNPHVVMHICIIDYMIVMYITTLYLFIECITYVIRLSKYRKSGNGICLFLDTEHYGFHDLHRFINKINYNKYVNLIYFINNINLINNYL